MSGLSDRLAKLEQAAGLCGPCQACALDRAFDARLGELSRSWGIPPPSKARLMRVSCSWCAGGISYPAADFTPEEVAAFERCDALYWRGEVCAPEFTRVRGMMAAAGERVLVARFGEHAEDVRRLMDEYGKSFDGITEMRAGCAYLCRLPGCECEYPKTFDEWRENVTANGFTVRGFVTI